MTHNSHRMQLRLFMLVLFCLLFPGLPTFACTRVLFAADDQPAVMVGRNMDWNEIMHTRLYAYPEGMVREGKTDVNAMRWTSKYGSLVAAVYDTVTTDGINERGLAAHVLWLREANYGERDQRLPGLAVTLWAQFYLDNFQTVDEAVKFTEAHTFQLQPVFHAATQQWLALHLALEDAKGDSAIIEYVNGSPRIYRSRDYTVMTNSPTYDLQLENLKNYQGFGGNKPLPGTVRASDRFVRAAFYSARLPASLTNRDEIASLLSVMQNTGEPYAKINASPTIWRVIADLSHGIYYFNHSGSFNMIWATLSKFNLNAGAPVMMLDVENKLDLVGEVTGEFEVG